MRVLGPARGGAEERTTKTRRACKTGSPGVLSPAVGLTFSPLGLESASGGRLCS